MIRKLLIANRGEIAYRIIRTCRRMGIATVAVYSSADAHALHVEHADEAVHLGASAASESYLNITKIITAAQRTGADAIHPGYGFLAENAAFAQAVIDAGLVWVGPLPPAIEAMGKKREAKLMLKDVPLVPGYSGEDQSDDTLIKAAAEIGYPVMVKASAGGGGKGMRRVDSADALPEELATARREATQAFGDDTLILEKLIESPRHIEIQLFGDSHGNVIALGERECSIQRRHQKIIEESPSPFVDDDLRGRMSATAISIGQQLGYTNAGTVEFLVDDAKNFYFMEMNTRLQVEHPVTEAVYGVDLVEWQIRVADGEPLPAQAVTMNGHAIEVRIYAEDPTRGFLPATGKVIHWDANAAGRCDAGVRSGDTVTTFYDPMIAKIIEHADTRTAAIRKMDYTLSKLVLLGLRNNIGFLRQVLTHADFIAGATNTQFIDTHPALFDTDSDSLPPTALIAVAIAHQHNATPSTHGIRQWRNNPNRPIKHTFIYEDTPYDILLSPITPDHLTAQINDTIYDVILPLENGALLDDGSFTMIVEGHRQQATVVSNADDRWLHLNGASYRLTWQTPLPLPGRFAAAKGSLRAPMPGQVINIRVEAGQQVAEGDILLTLEAMKMEHRIQAPYAGVVGQIYYGVGDSVQADAVLLEINAAKE